MIAKHHKTTTFKKRHMFYSRCHQDTVTQIVVHVNSNQIHISAVVKGFQ